MKHFMKVSLIVSLMVGICSGLYSNGFNRFGNGSKAIAMGGAFVGLADDHSALFWNPAGLTQLHDNSLSIYSATDFISGCSYKLTKNSLIIDALSVPRPYISRGLSYFNKSKKWAIGGAYTSTGFDVEWRGSELQWLNNGKPFEWETIGKINAFSVGCAYELSDIFSIGAAIDANHWFFRLYMPDIPQGDRQYHLGQYRENTKGWSFASTLGLFFKPCNRFSAGLTLKFPIFKLNGEGRATLSEVHPFDPNMPPASGAKRTIDFPLWVGFGIAIEPLDDLILTADIQYTKWETIDTIQMEFREPKWKVFQTDYNFKLEWKDSFQLRFGLEYDRLKMVTFRLGYYHDPNPGPKMSQTILLPVHKFDIITGGLSVIVPNCMTIDFGVAYGIGKKVVVSESDLNKGYPGMEGTHTLKGFIMPNITVTFHF